MKKIIKKLLRKLGYRISRIASDMNLPEFVYLDFYGQKLLINSFNPLYNWYKKYPQYNSELYRILSIVVSKYPDLAVVDIGANVGDTLCIIKSVFNGLVICVEGDSYTFDILQKNSLLFNNVTVINTYLGERIGVINAHVEKDQWNSTIIPTLNESGKQIQLQTLDNLLENIQENIKVIKIDTEGFDTIILRGSMKTIQNFHPIILLEYNRHNMDAIGENGYLTIQWLRSIGYKYLFVYESQGRFILMADMDNELLVKHLHEYIDGVNTSIYYFDFCLFHKDDADIATLFCQSEEAYRLNKNELYN